MVKYLEQLEKQFVTEGGIKERMHAARTGYRNGMDNRLHELEAEAPGRERLLRRLTRERREALRGGATPEDRRINLQTNIDLQQFISNHIN